jgi:hypothetical protein
MVRSASSTEEAERGRTRTRNGAERGHAAERGHPARRDAEPRNGRNPRNGDTRRAERGHPLSLYRVGTAARLASGIHARTATRAAHADLAPGVLGDGATRGPVVATRRPGAGAVRSLCHFHAACRGGLCLSMATAARIAPGPGRRHEVSRELLLRPGGGERCQ